ncbi:unnamed protein product [Adineta ricciae]|uniref:Uncharacterized protein n=1 Tax=Adineta ricciae TaxID=249248 RepID=A0A815IZ72_ADIRI|nr:unnamed protein product [Adineta ricciae]
MFIEVTHFTRLSYITDWKTFCEKETNRLSIYWHTKSVSCHVGESKSYQKIKYRYVAVSIRIYICLGCIRFSRYCESEQPCAYHSSAQLSSYLSTSKID